MPVQPCPRRRGFTLVEVLVAMGIVLIIGAMVTPMIIAAVKREKEATLRTSLRQIRQAIDDYKQAGDEGRIERRPGDSGYPRSLAVLVTGVPDRLDPKQRRLYFLRKVPRDPFATNDRQSAEDTWGKRSYASPPDKPEPGEDVYDVYSQSPAVGSNGIPYRQW
ncbi:MAG: type II secretion system protein [Burkholderiales bacterium]|mgnify:CR=1 FL=1